MGSVSPQQLPTQPSHHSSYQHSPVTMIFKWFLLLPLIATSTDGFGFGFDLFPDWTMPTMPTFSDLFNWTHPGTADVSGSSLNLTVLDINNETARLGCTWSGQGTA